MNEFSPLKILLIEGNQEHAAFIKSAFDNDLYDISVIFDGEKAYNFLLTTKETPDIVLLDYQLPSMDGFEIIKKLRKNNKEFAYIFLTADNSIDTVIKVLKEGAFDFISKSSDLHKKLPLMVEKIHQIYRDRVEKKLLERELKESEEKFRTLIEHAVDGILMTDPEGVILEINPSGSNMLAYKKSDLIGKNIFSFIHKSYLKKSINVFENLQANQKIVLEGKFVDANKKTLLVEISSKRLTDGRIQAIVRDISERKKTEQKLIKSEQKLKELNATKDKLFSIVAHDLQNPFNSLIGISELLLKNYKELDNEKVEHLLELIYQSANQGTCLIENLLTWSRTQTGRIKWNPQKLSLNALINKNIKFLNASAQKKNIEMTFLNKENLDVFCDSNMIHTVLRNLISNAVKFTNINGKITIRVQKKDNFAVIEVVDNGIGILKKDQKKLFRLDLDFSTKGTAKEVGTGLGLILCKEFVEKNGGIISVTSEKNIGSTFTFTIPLS